MPALVAAGVPDELIGQPWQGSPLSNGGVRANIAGLDSICGLALIGKGTQIDKGLNVASCMPVSLIQSEQGRAMGKQGLITLAGAVLASVLAAGALKLLGHEPKTTAVTAGVVVGSDGAAVGASVASGLGPSVTWYCRGLTFCLWIGGISVPGLPAPRRIWRTGASVTWRMVSSAW